jgi:toxin CptA
MHTAPSVSYPVGRSAFAAGLQAAIVLAGLAAAAAWSVQSSTFGWRQGLAFGAVLVGAALATLAWLRSPTGTLHWDGNGWNWQEGRQTGPGDPEPALDLQSRMLVKWRPAAGRARWLWLEKQSAPAHWDALRRAVYSRARAPVPRAGEPPAAEQ